MDNLDDELTLATASMCERDVQVNCDMHGVKTVVLPKVFKWFAKDFGDDKLASLTFIDTRVMLPPSRCPCQPHGQAARAP